MDADTTSHASPPAGVGPLTLHALSVEGVRVHLYGKSAYPGRKVGHVTALGIDLDETRERAQRAVARLARAAEPELSR